MDTYFRQFEDRTPPPAVPYSAARELLWQFFAVISVVTGVWYIVWRWGWSLNFEALWFAIPLLAAETLSFIGTVLFTVNLWKTDDVPQKPAPRTVGDIDPTHGNPGRPLSVDVFFPSYDEDPELVRLSVADAKAIRYPHPIDMKIYVLDDGGRPEMAAMAEEEGVGYISRDDNVGFKAGNLRNAMEQTSGDIIVICDADTRPFPTLLQNTLGYFTDPDVAWVQTPQWFFDIPPGRRLPDVMKKFAGRPGHWVGRQVEKVIGRVDVDSDPYDNDPSMFYDVIQRRRNWANAAFCCGAGSLQRREAVMQAALREFSDEVDSFVADVTSDVDDADIKRDLDGMVRQQMATETEFTPFKFHVSEDIYTSIVLHGDRTRNWRSVYHPGVECKMLSPQDLLSWVTQRFKYAGGTLDIFFHDNPTVGSGLSFWQRVMYTVTFFSYFSCIWNIVFLLAPIIYLFSGVAPVSSYSAEFFIHILPFLVFQRLAFMIGTWGVPTLRGQSTYLAFFALNFRALWTVLKGEKIKFPATPKDRQSGIFPRLVIPQMVIVALTLGGLAYAGLNIALGRSDDLTGLLTNVFWGLNNMAALGWIIRAAFWQPDDALVTAT